MRIPCLLLVAACSVVGCAGASDGSSGATSESGLTETSCDVKDYGAKGDGKTKDTAAIQRAIDACAGHGGEVHLRAGTFLSGTIHLKSAMTFHVHGGATLKGTLDDVDYPDTNPPSDNTQLSNCKKALVYAESVHDLHITGTGTIDGSGNVQKWLGPSATNPERTRPMAMFFVASTNITIENISVKESAMWSVVNMEVDGLTIRNISVDSTHGSTRDGIDIVDSHHVLVDGCTVKSEDDGICLKSGSAHGVDDVTIKNSHVLASGVANALKLGTASYGAFTNITFDTIDVHHSDKAAMAVESVDGSGVANVVFKNITFEDVGTPFFVLIGDRGLRPEHASRRIGTIDGVRFEHIRGSAVRHDWGAIVSGYATPKGELYRATNIAFDDVEVAMAGGAAAVPADPPEYASQYPDPNLWGQVPAFGLFVRHAGDVSFTATTFTAAKPDARRAIEAHDVSSLSFE